MLDKALDLYEHTSTLIANEKIFDRTYKGLIDKIDNASMMIYHCCRSANEDFDARVKEDAAMRLKLQEEAIENCKWLKSAICSNQLMVTRTGIEKIPSLSATFSKMRKWL